MSFKEFQGGLKRKQLVGSRCLECGELVAPPRMLCPHCGSEKLEPYSLRGVGELVTFTVVHVPLTRYREVAPYSAGLVKLDEGPMVAGFLKVDEGRLRVGLQVEIDFEESHRKMVPVFKAV